MMSERYKTVSRGDRSGEQHGSGDNLSMEGMYWYGRIYAVTQKVTLAGSDKVYRGVLYHYAEELACATRNVFVRTRSLSTENARMGVCTSYRRRSQSHDRRKEVKLSFMEASRQDYDLKTVVTPFCATKSKNDVKHASERYFYRNMSKSDIWTFWGKNWAQTPELWVAKVTFADLGPWHSGPYRGNTFLPLPTLQLWVPPPRLFGVFLQTPKNGKKAHFSPKMALFKGKTRFLKKIAFFQPEYPLFRKNRHLHKKSLV